MASPFSFPRAVLIGCWLLVIRAVGSVGDAIVESQTAQEQSNFNLLFDSRVLARFRAFAFQ